MRVFLLCCLAVVSGFETVSSVPPQKAQHHPARPGQSQDVSLLKPGHAAYADASEFARFLDDNGVNVKSMHRSTLEGFFRDVDRAAFFRTGMGVVQVIFFPEPTGAERVQVTERRRAGRYVYSFRGQPRPNPPGDTFDSGRPMYFLTHRNWFIVPDSKELYDALKDVLKDG
jgi:hypothetical protein